MRKRKSPSPLCLLAFLAGASNFAQAESYITPQEIQPPELNYARLGDIFLAGDFDGISQLTYKGQAKMLAYPNPGRDDIIIGYENDIYMKQDFSNGRVDLSCTMGDNETVIMVGNFTSIFNTSIENGLAAVNFNNQTAYSLGNFTNNGDHDTSSSSKINAIWCNGTQAYFGGSFKFGNTYGAAIWNQLSGNWTLPAFGGFVGNSSVNAIVPYKENIVFGGNFSGLASIAEQTNSSTNSSMRLDPGMQPVSFSLANASGYETSQAGAENASSILCPYSDDDGWKSGLDSTTGYIDIALAYMSQPTRIRLFNLPDGSGTKSFRIISEPAGSFMNLTFVDEQGIEGNCAASCPLPEYNDSIRYSDFKFVNVVPTSSLKIELLDFYGTHAGLKGVQLFEAGQFAFANNAFNSPRQCGDGGNAGMQQVSRSATSELSGSTPWKINHDFMSTNITDKSKLTLSEAKLIPTFDSYAINRGFYEVLLYTPGCKQYGTCGFRGAVNVTVYPGFSVPQNTILYQTNEDLKYDVVYNGTLQHGSYISLVPVAGNNVPMDFVAYKVSLNYLGSPQVYNASKLFEYSPSNFTSGSTESLPVGATQINILGQALGNDASVNALLLNGPSSLTIGGTAFPSNISSSSNLISLSLDASSSNADKVTAINGVNSEVVNELYNINQTLFVLSENETYRLEQSENMAGNSLEASSLNIGQVSTVVPFLFNDTQYWMFSSASDLNVNASFWDSSTSSLEVSRIPVSGHLSGRFAVSNATIYTGSLRVASSYIPNGAAILSESSAESPESPYFSLGASARLEESEMKISLISEAESSVSGVLYAGTYFNSSHSIIVGHFNATASDNSTVANAIIATENKSSVLLGSDFSLPADKTTFLGVASFNKTIVLGGNFSGSAGSSDIQGVLVIDNNGSYKEQPRPLNAAGEVSVREILFQPNTSNVVVGGSFSSAEGVVTNGSCNGICLLSLDNMDWMAPENLNLNSGSAINSLVFETGTKLVIAGNLIVGNSKGQVAVYDFANSTMDILPQLPGQASNLVVLSNSSDNNQYAVSGLSDSGVFIKWFDGANNEWDDVPGVPLLANSNISTLSVVMLNNETSGSSGLPFNSSRALLVSGSLNLPEGPVSSLLFDGSHWQPLYGTTSSNPNLAGTVQAVFAQYAGDLKGGVTYREATKSSHPRSPHPSSTQSPPHHHQNGNNGKKYMAKGHVVGIACGIGICCVLVLMVLYMIIEYAFAKGSRTFAYQNLAQSRSAADRMKAN